MNKGREILRFFDKGFILKISLLFLFYSLLLLFDSYILLRCALHIDHYLLLALSAGTGVIAFLFLLHRYAAVLRELREKIQIGIFPRREFMRIISLISAGILLLTPGFASDCLGILCYLYPMGRLIGAGILRLYSEEFLEVYEYLRLSDTKQK